MFRLFVFLTCFFCVPCAILAQEQDAPSLDGALWSGVAEIHVKGSLHDNFMTRRQNQAGLAIGFVKEKGRFQIDYHLTVHFQVNALGEVSFVANDTFEGEKTYFREFWYTIEEKDTKYAVGSQRIKVSETRNRKYPFSYQGRYSAEEFQGSFRVQPTGMMDKSGSMKILISLETKYESEGRVYSKRETKPESTKVKPEKSIKKSKTSFILPIEAELDVIFQTVAVGTSKNVNIQIENPFKFKDNKENSPTQYRQNLETTISCRITPLFEAK